MHASMFTHPMSTPVHPVCRQRVVERLVVADNLRDLRQGRPEDPALRGAEAPSRERRSAAEALRGAAVAGSGTAGGTRRGSGGGGSGPTVVSALTAFPEVPVDLLPHAPHPRLPQRPGAAPGRTAPQEATSFGWVAAPEEAPAVLAPAAEADAPAVVRGAEGDPPGRVVPFGALERDRLLQTAVGPFEVDGALSELVDLQQGENGERREER